MEDLRRLHNLSSRVDARSLQRNADAAMLRTALWENAAQGGITWRQMQTEHDRSHRATPHVIRASRQADWHRDHIASHPPQHLAHGHTTPRTLRSHTPEKATCD